MDYPTDEDILASISDSRIPNAKGNSDTNLTVVKKVMKIFFVESDEDKDEDEGETSNVIPTFEQIYSSIEKLRTFMESRNNVPDYI